MPPFLHSHIITYGYLAIFCIVLIQEMGMPGLPNELVLLYCGVLAKQAGLSYLLIFSLVVSADILAAAIVYFSFFYGRHWLLRFKPKWLPLPYQKIRVLKMRIAAGSGRNLFLAKLTPFVRSYIPAVAGLLKVSPALYARVVIVAAVTWSGGLVTAGWLFSF